MTTKLNLINRDSLAKASYAFRNDDHLYPQGHLFQTSERTAACKKCGRTREQVRWDDLPPQCIATAERVHRFGGCAPWSCCIYCSKSRESLGDTIIEAGGFGSLECPDWRAIDIKSVIRCEEEKAYSLMSKAEKKAPEYIRKMGMSGATLVFLHDTHGWDPEIIEGLLDIPKSAKEEYDQIRFKQSESNRHLTRSKAKIIHALTVSAGKEVQSENTTN